MKLGVPCAIFAAAAVAVGCGGDGQTTIDSKADFIAAGDRICLERDERSLDLAGTSENGNAADLTGELAEIYAMTIAKFQELALPPGDDRAAAAKFVESVATMAGPVRRMKEAAVALDAARAAAAIKERAQELELNVNTVTAISDRVDQNAREYGFKSCGKQRTNPVA